MRTESEYPEQYRAVAVLRRKDSGEITTEIAGPYRKRVTARVALTNALGYSIKDVEYPYRERPAPYEVVERWEEVATIEWNRLD